LYDSDAGYTAVDPNDPDDPNQTNPDNFHDNDILNPGVGVDVNYGGYGDDKFVAAGLTDGLEGDVYDGGGVINAIRIDPNLDGKDTVDYSALVYGILVDLRNPMAGTAAKFGGGGATDTLISIENLKLGSGDDWTYLSSPTGHVIDGGGGTNSVWYYTSAGYFDTVNGKVYDAAASTFDTLTNIHAVNFNFSSSPPVFVIPDLQSNVLPSFTSLSGTVLDFSGASGLSETQFSSVIVGGTTIVNTSTITVDGVTHDLANGVNIRGSNFGDTYDLTGGLSNQTGVHTLYTGTGDSTVLVQFAGSPIHTIVYTGGNDTYSMSAVTQEIIVLGISIDSISLNYSGATGTPTFDATIGTAKGTITLHYNDSYPYDKIVKFYDGTLHFTSNPSTQAELVTIIEHENNFANTPYFTWGADDWISPEGFTGNGGDIYALGGNDTLTVNSGTFNLYGGPGDDRYVLSLNGMGTVIDHDGRNTIETDVASTNFSFDVSGDTINLYHNDPTLFATVNGISSFSTVTFSDGVIATASSLIANQFDYIQVQADGSLFGTDLFIPEALVLHLQDNVSTYWATGLGDTIWGSDNNTEFFGSTGNDVFYGGAGDDSLWGGEDDDALYGGGGNDYLRGGAGNNIIDGGDGTIDSVSYSDAPSGIIVDLSQGLASQNGWGGTDILKNIQFVDGSAFDDQIAGSTGNDQLAGEGGNDILTGHGGIDQYQGGAGSDTINGGIGTDIITYVSGDGEDTIHETGGFDTINLFGVAQGSVTYTRTADDLNIRIDSANGINISDFFSGSSADVVERVFFAQSGTYFDLTSLLTGNSPPVAQDDSFNAAYGQAINGNVLADNGSGADSDPDNDALSVVESSVTTANGFSIALAPTGGFTFAPTPDFVGTDSFTYTVSDGQGHTDTATVTLNISAPAGAIVGTSGDDTLNGTTGTDTIFGLAGADIINADAGNDTIYGGLGNDTISGGDGIDLIGGGSGDDAIDGGAGKDTADYSAASSGVNVNLATGTASDGNGGTDTLTGIENVIGSAFADILTGNSAGNVLNGRAGNDTITGNNSADTLIGGAGNDALDGSNGNDTADYSAAASGIVLDLAAGTASNDGDAGADTLANIENVTGSAYADNITGNSAANTINGGAGDDVIDADGGDDTLKGGAGTDTLNGGSGNDTVDYGAAVAGIVVNLSTGTTSNDGDGGSDTLTSIENVIGSSNSDLIVGDANANILNGAGSADTLSGGGGNDSLNGGGGTDTADYSAAASGITLDLTAGTASNDGDGGSDTLTNIENVTGSAYGDTVTGSGGNNVITTDGGVDSVYAGVGNDTIRGGTGNDTLYGEDGDDTLYGEADDDYLDGSAGNDILIGGLGNDTMDGGSGTDTVNFSAAVTGVIVNLVAGTATGDGSDTLYNIENVTGSAYGDTLTGDGNANALNGGDGDDIIVGGAGNDAIDGGNGSDTVDYSGAAAGVTVNLLAGTASDGFGGADTISHIENVIGSDYADTITGSNISNLLSGGAGDDIISGSGAADTLIGGAGNDTLNGNGGSDVADYSAAASGVVVNLAAGVASNDGYGGTDTLSTIEWATGSAYNDSITGSGGANTLNGGDGDDTINGGGGSDTLNGGAGNDSLDGGGGSDILYGGGGSDYLTGSAGADSFILKALTAMSASVTISDFHTSQNDKIDISDVLAGHYNLLQDAISDFVSLTTSGGSTLLNIDLDGSGSSQSSTQIASLAGVTGLNLNDLIENGNLIVQAA
jgi:Ca2+-binding RTX toxin-like protein